jgi:predicted dienelactone hydrolase
VKTLRRTTCSSLLAIAMVVTASAPIAGASAGTTTRTGPPFSVRKITYTFVDRARPTVDPDHLRDSPVRTLATDVYVPVGAKNRALVVFAHGAAGHPRKFGQLFTAWAKRGYVVAAPAFPLSNDRSGGPVVLDYPEQARDMSFVLSRVLYLSRHGGNLLAGTVNPKQIGAAGLSLGGATVYGFSFTDGYRDPRVKATIVMSGIAVPFPGATPVVSGMPVMIMHGTADPIIPYPTAVNTYATAGTPKYLVSLLGGGHAEPYEDSPSPFDALVPKLTIDFWDAYLRGNDGARARIVTDGTVAGLSTVDHAG